MTIHTTPSLCIRPYLLPFLLAAVLSLTLAGCGGGGGDGSTGATFTASVPGPAAGSVLVATMAEPAGTNCAAGGVRIRSGLDTNGNSVLDDGEVKDAVFACNGAPGAPGAAGSPGTVTASLVRTGNEPSGANCAAAGIRIQSGPDTNNNGALEESEVKDTVFACNGTAGTASTATPSLLRSSTEPAGANCAAGGVRIQSGQDASGNGTLEDSEVRFTNYACNGTAGTGGSGPGPSGPTGAPGPVGPVGASGLNSLISTVAEPAGNNCAAGGVKIQVGLDLNSDGQLAIGEVQSTSYVCGAGVAAVVPIFASHPASVTIKEGNNTSFTVAFSGAPTPALQWQLSTDGGASWSNITGITNATFYVTNAALANNGRQFRVLATNGSGAAASNAATLTIVPRSWSAAAAIEIDNVGDALYPQIAVNASGNTVVVWQQDGDAGPGVRHDIWANRYTAQGWGTAVLIEGAAGNATQPQVAIDASGNALAVWQQAGATGDSIWSNRYTAGAGWGTPVMIQANSEFAQSVQITMDANGNALAAWVQINTGYRIWANRYTPGTGWGTAALIDTNSTADQADAPDIAFDASGNAMVVWTQSNASVSSIWANRYAAGTGWGTATLIETGSGNAFGGQVVMDASGNALAVWSQTNGTVYSVWANRYSAGAWGTAALIETDNSGSANAPQIAIDSFGNVIAVWSQSNGTINNIWANRFTAGAWGVAVLIETNNSSFADAPKIAAAANGNVLAVWNQFRPITYNHFTINSGWGAAALVDSNPNNEPTGGPQIAVDGTGEGFAVWAQFDGTRLNIMASSFR